MMKITALLARGLRGHGVAGRRATRVQAEKLPAFGDMLVLFAIGVACFGIPLQAGFAVIRLIQRHLGRIALRNQPKVLTGETTVPIEQR
jgi:hypothetical protein